MKLRFLFGGVPYSVASILEFTKSGQSNFWREIFFRFYPDVNKAAFYGMSADERYQYLLEYFTAFYEKNRVIMEDKLSAYNRCWWQYEPQIINALEDAFAMDLADKFNDLICHTTFNPISPRYLDRNMFDNFYLESEKGALGTAIHEIIHFVWFYVWQQRFQDNPAEYESPHLKWILSEMVVEPVMRDSRLGQINPYYGNKSCVYPYFYTMRIDGEPVLDVLNRMYATMPIEEFMERSYQYCVAHEAEIRRHITDSENS